MPGVLTIPVAVARAVLLSEWAASVPLDASTPQNRIFVRYKDAVTKVWARKIPYSDSERLLELREPIAALLAEPSNGASLNPAALKAVVAFDEQLGDALAREEAAKVQAAEQEKVKAAEQAVEFRRWDKEHQETTMSGLLEVGRQKKIREICEDYGLDAKDPKIRAGLTAAYHCGVLRYRDVVASLVHHDPQQVPVGDMEKLVSRDKAMFAGAGEPTTEGER